MLQKWNKLVPLDVPNNIVATNIHVRRHLLCLDFAIRFVSVFSSAHEGALGILQMWIGHPVTILRNLITNEKRTYC